MFTPPQNSLSAIIKTGYLIPSLSFALLSSTTYGDARVVEKPTPNILVIMVDDAGYNDFGFQGNDSFRQVTPNLDRLAARSARLTHAYVTATVCGPSRAGFITGIYQQRFGFQENFPSHWGDNPDGRWRTDAWKDFGLDTSQTTMADFLQNQGYRTGIIGKWHLGYAEPFHPNERGFDYFFGFRSGARSYFSNPEYNETDQVPYNWRSLEENREIFAEEGVTYLTELLTDKAISFIEESSELEQPYFLFLSHLAPHTPMHATEEDLKIAQEMFPEAAQRRQIYTAMMLNLDRGVGAVLDTIESLGQTDNTLIVFLSDNGGARNNASDNTPLRGTKYSPYEAGARVPMLISWPGVIAEGIDFHPVVSSLDLLPTFLEAAHHDPVDNLDGISLLSWLMTGDATDFPNRHLFWRENTFYAATEWIRSKEDERAIWFVGDVVWRTPRPDYPSFFNLRKDPKELEDLGPVSQERVEELREQFEVWASELSPRRW